MDLLNIITILIIISAVFSYLNVRFIKLPGTIGVVTIAVVVSILILIAGKTSVGMANIFRNLAENINFSDVLLNVMLGFLLFASALHFDYKELKKQRLPVLLLSTLGVLVSTGVFAVLLYGIARLLRIDLPMIYCFVFGALISPTDPIAVSAILKNSKIPPKLNTIISGESLFNDAVGLILFVIFLNIAEGSGKELSAMVVFKMFIQEVAGGIIIGAVLGYLGYRMIRSIKDFQSILLISIALVLSISAVAHQLHASIPLAAVTAGLIIGTKTLDKRHIANQFLNRIWQLLDQVLNTILFVMIGLQLVVMPFLNHYWLIGLFSIVIVLLARLASVSLPAIPVLRKVNFSNFFILTWAGLRGGISIAMALTLPASPYREIILSCCYIVVIFSIIVQGLTLNSIVERAARVKD
ncbi:MAG: sodium:proton antiporter [Chitinophagaceae bacterium]|nr:MAG: sodium:proton antiporter [Chitinophagaceae bacterium]